MHQFCRFSFFLVFVTTSAWGKGPNIVLLMADDMGFECIGANGCTSYQTPRIDELAQAGVRFTNCFSTPICTPTRVQIMTGQYNFRNYSHFGYLHPNETTFGHLLKTAGYATCIAGKWQLNGIYHTLPGHQDRQRPLAAGFDESCLWQVTRQKKHGERFADPLIEVNGDPPHQHVGKYGPDIFCDFICDFIRRNKDEPFFCYYPMVLVHDPFVPTPDSDAWQSGDRYQRDGRFFADMVAYTDKIVGRVLDVLETEGVADQTLVIFTGDNGTHRSITTATRSGPVRGAKGLTVDTGIHVPLFVTWPGMAAEGQVCEDLIDFTDVLPTLLEAAQISNTGLIADGRSFLPQIKGQQGNPREHIFCHYDPRWGPMAKQPSRFARDKQYKLYDDGRFYLVAEDPLERQSLTATNETELASRQRLQAVLDSMPAWRK